MRPPAAAHECQGCVKSTLFDVLKSSLITGFLGGVLLAYNLRQFKCS